MKKLLIVLLFAAIVMAAALPVCADEELLWTNLNEDMVYNGPTHYIEVPVKVDEASVLITKIRTYHYNNGNGAAPGLISVYEGDECLGSWQAVGRSAYGTPNVYWEALVDVVMYPGHRYHVKVSDNASWSYNAASKECGMFELYGIWPAPEAAQNISSADLPVGATFRMGRWEQNNDTGDGTETIEWQILSVERDRMLVISRYELEAKTYPEMTQFDTWETSSFRRWLNGDFYNEAFSPEEKAQILTVINDNPDNPEHGTDGGNKTQDKIFLLSFNEANWYFSSDDARKCKATESVKAAGAFVDSGNGGTSLWLLRSPGAGKGLTSMVSSAGQIDLTGLVCGSQCETVYLPLRPAFWMKRAAARPAPTAVPTPRNCFKVKYNGNNCLTQVPTDKKCYQKGDKVTVLFDPVGYIPGLIFNGWDRTGDGTADHGYYYNSFIMPGHDVELKAICYRQQYQDRYEWQQIQEPPARQPQDGIPGEITDPQQHYDPYRDPGIRDDIYDPGTGWWYDPGTSYDPGFGFDPGYSLDPGFGFDFDFEGVG